MKMIFLLSLFTILFVSCDPYVYNVEIDDNGFKKEIVFDCGKVDISAHVLGFSQITIFQKFKPSCPISINPNELTVSYKNQILSTTVSLNGDIMKNTMDVLEESSISIVINLPKINNGDTIKLNVDKFINCRENTLKISDINLIVVSRK